MKSHGSSRSSPPPAEEGEEKEKEKEQEKERGEERGIVFHHRNNYHKPGQKNEDESAPPSLLLSSLAHTQHTAYHKAQTQLTKNTMKMQVMKKCVVATVLASCMMSTQFRGAQAFGPSFWAGVGAQIVEFWTVAVPGYVDDGIQAANETAQVIVEAADPLVDETQVFFEETLPDTLEDVGDEVVVFFDETVPDLVDDAVNETATAMNDLLE